MKNLSMFLCAVAFLLAAGNASAGFVIYSDRTAFETAFGASNLDRESFETSFATGSPIVFDAFSVSETTSGGGTGHIYHSDNTAGGGISATTHGDDAIYFFDNGGSIGSFFDFGSSSVNAFGLDITANSGQANNFVDIDFGSGTFQLTLGNNTPAFFGVIDDGVAGISNVTFDFGENPAPWVGFDNVQYGVVPVPAAAPMILMGMGLVGMLRRSRRSTKEA